MASEFRIVRRVEFSETDMAGIMHFSNFFRYMEAAEQAFLRWVGLSVVMRNTEPPIGFPRVPAECDYTQPLHFEDEVEVQLQVTEKKQKALSYAFRFLKLNAQPPMEVAVGTLTVVCVTHDQDGRMQSMAI